jgi:hypothetical protein
MEEMFGKVILTIERCTKRLLAEPDPDVPASQLSELLKRIGEDDHGTV